MKKFQHILVLAMALLAPQIIQAQGTTYLSNLGQTSNGKIAVGSDLWLAGDFRTGNSANGYSLNSVQLAMADASGNASGFTVMLYAPFNDTGSGPIPGNSLGTLDGSSNPSTAGIYTYNDDSSIMLSPNTYYFIVVTAVTTVANGAYEWSYTDTSIYNPGDAWVLSISLDSNDGSNWNFLSSTYSQFAINATPVPEPSTWMLLMAGAVLLLVKKSGLSRRREKPL